MSSPKTPKTKTARRWKDTPIPPPTLKARCKEIEPKLFYSPIKKEESVVVRSIMDAPALPTLAESPAEEPQGQCLECGTIVSAHTHLCGKSRCLTPKLGSDLPQEKECIACKFPNRHRAHICGKKGTKSVRKRKAEEVECEPFMEWKTRELRYPHSMTGEPLHDLVAAMLRIDREACVRFYDKTLGV